MCAPGNFEVPGRVRAGRRAAGSMALQGRGGRPRPGGKPLPGPVSGAPLSIGGRFRENKRPCCAVSALSRHAAHGMPAAHRNAVRPPQARAASLPREAVFPRSLEAIE
ncbi:hypothetical protein GCM10028797_07760 [Dyella agri]